MIRFHLADLIAKAEFEQARRIELAEISAETAIHRSTLSRMLHTRGYNATVSAVDKLCVFFQCRVEDVISHVPDAQNAPAATSSPASSKARKAA